MVDFSDGGIESAIFPFSRSDTEAILELLPEPRGSEFTVSVILVLWLPEDLD